MSKPVVVFCFDENYRELARVAIGSLFSSTLGGLRVYLVVPEEIEEMVRVDYSGPKIPESVEVRVVRAEIPLQGYIPYDYHFNESTFLRLLLPELIDEDRVIYSDSDVIFLSDVRELFETDLEGRLLAAVPEPEAAPYTRVQMADKSKYVNAGVMLMDLKKMREENFTAKTIALYRRSPDDFTFCDQCVINYYAEGWILPLDKKWNWTMRCEQTSDDEFSRALESASVIHFIANHKPWTGGSNTKISEAWIGFRRRMLFTYFD